MNKFYNKQTGVISHLCFYIVTPEKSRQKKLRLSGTICRFFDNCINECCNVGEGSPLPSRRRLQTLAHLQIPPATSSLSICGQKTSVIGLNRLYKKKTEMKNHLCFYYYPLSPSHANLFRAKQKADDIIICFLHTQRMCIKNRISKTSESKRSLNSSSPRSISIGQLNTLLCLHLRPIKLVVYK